MPLNVGLIGCGDISDAYLSNGDAFDEYQITACANRTRARADEKAEEYGIEAMDVDELLDNPDIDIVLNLTPPNAHADINIRALEAGKHVYTEKPIATSLAASEQTLETAAEQGLSVGSAPDTILGAALQTCRSIVEEGRIGRPIGATVHWTHQGHETWHPNPDFFYQEGAGPLLDVGPYYISTLVTLLGSASQVTGTVGQGFDQRTITNGPRQGETIDVEVPTHEAGIVTFDSGVIANVLLSFDVPGGTSAPDPFFEIYGTEGTLQIPDPNFFDGTVRISTDSDGEFEVVPHTHEYTQGRGVGIADLARAIESDWEQRTSGQLAHHTLDIMESIRTAADREEHVAIESDCVQPPLLPPSFPNDRSE